MNPTEATYNPDVLLCLANLSNDEVFTPPKVAEDMLDLLPKELFSDPRTTFLDPVSKSGVFLREIAKRLMIGLEDQIPDLQERIEHIYTKQLYGIAITELTALLSRRSVYCSKFANGKYSIVKSFDSENGNIEFERVEHKWFNDKCVFCGASQAEYDRKDELETHAYKFIHTNKPEELYDMKFDVIIGNPPYQMSDGGAQASATPIYQKFVMQAIKIQPRYLIMITPSRWFTGGKGLDEFRDQMLKDKRITTIVDYPNATECFPGVKIEGGVNYFLWEKDKTGDVDVRTLRDGITISRQVRPLLEPDARTFIRYNEAVGIYRKIKSQKLRSFSSVVSSRKPFGLDSAFKDFKPKENENDIKIYANKSVGYLEVGTDFKSGRDLIGRHKVYISYAYGMGDKFPSQIINKPFVGEQGSACTETYIVIGPFNSRVESLNAARYMSTRFFRFMVMLKKNTQHATSKVYEFVPVQDFAEEWTDEKLYEKYGINEDEIAFIESMIRPMELDT